MDAKRPRNVLDHTGTVIPGGNQCLSNRGIIGALNCRSRRNDPHAYAYSDD